MNFGMPNQPDATHDTSATEVRRPGGHPTDSQFPFGTCSVATPILDPPHAPALAALNWVCAHRLAGRQGKEGDEDEPPEPGGRSCLWGVASWLAENCPGP